MNFYDKEMFETLCNVLKDEGPQYVQHRDIANALQSLAHFEHLDMEVMKMLLQKSIETCERMNV